MPDDTPSEKSPSEKDEDLEHELSEFEAELFKAAEGVPRTAIEKFGNEEGEAPRDLGIEGQREGGKEAPSVDERIREALEKLDLELADSTERAISQFEAANESLASKPIVGSDDEFEERLRSLERRAVATKRRRESERAMKERKLASDQEDYRGMGLGLSIAYMIIGMPLAGWLVGWLLFRQTGSVLWIPFLAFGGMAAGLAAALIMLQRHQK